MHHYQHNIKTFNHATRHLTRVERALYRDLIELYYDTEQPLPAASFDRLCRLVLAHSDDEKTALHSVLDEFFVLTGDVYTHDYCDAQIEKYRANSTSKAKAGKASADARKEKAANRQAERKQTLNTCSTDVQLTSNQEPITINKDINTLPAKAVSVVKQSNGLALLSGIDNLPEQVAEDFLKVRKAKRSPLTATALALIEREAVKAGLTTAQAIAIAAARGWQSFKADWIADNDGKTTAERTQDFKDRQAEKAYAPLLDMTPEERAAWGFK